MFALSSISRRWLSRSFDLGGRMKELNDRGEYEKSLSLFRSNGQEGARTLVINQALKASIELKDFAQGKAIHRSLSPFFLNNSFIRSSLIRLYLKCREIDTSVKIYKQSPERTLVMSNDLLNGLVENNRSREALDLFERMPGKRNEHTHSILFKICASIADEHALRYGQMIFKTMPHEYQANRIILTSYFHMLIRCGDNRSAEELFNGRLVRNVISYGAIMKIFNDNGQADKTLKLFEKMKEEQISPNEIIFQLLLDACSQIGDFSLAQRIVSQIPLKSHSLDIGLINLWGKVGSINDARNVFDTIEHPNIICFTAMVHSYGLNGLGEEALQLFYQIPKEMLDDRVYTCALNSCSHSGLIEQAWKIFSNIPIEQRTERIYTAMVKNSIDGLSRVSSFDLAEQLICEYEHRHSPSMPMYMSMLSGARNAKNAELAQQIFARIELKSPDDSSYLLAARVLLANTLGLSGDRSGAAINRIKLQQTKTRKIVGLSWTVVDGKVFKFRAHDRTHPQWNEIDQQLKQITEKLNQCGHKHDSSWITRELSDHETVESVLCGHSERIAIAFNLIQRPVPTRIQIVKNLRVCGDCHAATKIIAQVYQCLIVVRDANRIHHFSPNGQCSCRDHF